MASYVLTFDQIGRAHTELVGGKGAHLGELSRTGGIRVPSGFCVTTEAYRDVVEQDASISALLDQLAALSSDDVEATRATAAELRQAFAAVVLPEDLTSEIVGAHARLGRAVPCAVRSSATAEDLPGSSFAGQQESYLNVAGAADVVAHIPLCWASLFTDRAVIYRQRNGFDHRRVLMAVVVQRMVAPQVSGVLFTADPISGNRTITSIEAAYGLGEALVGGRASADSFKVRDGAIVDRTIASKVWAVHAAAGGGTERRPVTGAERDRATLTVEQVLELARLGRAIEARLEGPQDIEWCLDGDGFHIVQSRPITALFPIPGSADDGNHVYLSVGHQQMMTDAMTPLGLSVWQHTTRAPMVEAGGRLFVDVTMLLASPASRPGFLAMTGSSDPLVRDALEAIIERDGFLPTLADDAAAPPLPVPPAPPTPPDPAIVAELIERHEASIDALRRDLEGRAGAAVVERIEEDFAELQQVLFDPEGMPVIMSALAASAWINEHVEEWLGEKGAADVLTHSVPNNVTSEMGLALLDVADAIRPHPAVIALLRDADDDTFLDALPTVDGGASARAAIDGFLDRYGMRCVGEIDIARPRWVERPQALIPLILSNVSSFEPGEAARRFERGRRDAAAKEEELLARLRLLPEGADKAREAKEMIDRLRALIGYREHPKYAMVSRYLLYKQALVGEADRLVDAGVLDDRQDVFFLRLEELREVVRTLDVDHDLVARRRAEHRIHQALTPPRVLTSEGEALNGSYRREGLPPGTLSGLPVSSGVVEGRARVVHDMSDADLVPGDILVTPHTDPSWSPLFVTAAGLVTEVGGLMTHGSVVAREYGLPAVVGVHDATRLIEDGQQIRLNGTEGYIEVLTTSPEASET